MEKIKNMNLNDTNSNDEDMAKKYMEEWEEKEVEIKDNERLENKYENSNPIEYTDKINEYEDLLPLTSIPAKRLQKYGNSHENTLNQLTNQKIEKKQQRDYEKEIEKLKNENRKLELDNKQMKDFIKNLTSEMGPEEDIDLKRMLLLKSQIIQLKRQVLIIYYYY